MVAPPPSIVPHPDVAFLRCTSSESGYRNVYRVHAGRGVDRWCAKVKTGGRLQRIPGSASPLPHQAALFVARWYRQRYGPEWPPAVAKRKARLKPWRVWRRPEGWAACVWEFGRSVMITGRRAAGHAAGGPDVLDQCHLTQAAWAAAGRPLAFASAAEAERAVRRWAVEWWGRYAHLAMWQY